MALRDRVQYGILTAVFLTAIGFLGYVPTQEQFVPLVLGYAAAFAAVIILYLKPRKFTIKQIRYWLIVALIARLILLGASPLLSDDVYRFYWDGLLVINGANPFHHLPSEIIGQSGFEYLSEDLYASLNSPDYYSVYPTISQLVFSIGAWLSPKSIVGFTIILKLIILLGESLTVFFGLKILRLLQQRVERIFLYALNPLIIIELSGNLHMEVLVLSGLSVGLYFCIKGPLWKSAMGWAVAIGVKLTPLILLPLLWRRVEQRRPLVGMLILTALLSGIILTPCVWSIAGAKFLDSIDLYFRSFEFNASVYYLVRKIGYAFKGYNLIAWIGPLLGIVSLIIITLNSLAGRKRLDWYRIISLMLWAYCIYLFLSTTVHPWYLSVPIFLSIFTRFRFPILWSILVVLSYSHYYQGDASEKYAWIVLEYSMVFIAFLWEWLRDCSIFPWLMDEDPKVESRELVENQ